MRLDGQQLKKLGFLFVEYTQGLPAKSPRVPVWEGGLVNDFGVIVRPTFSVWAQELPDGQVGCNGFVTIVIYNIQMPTKKWWRRTVRYELFNIVGLLPILAVNRSQDFCLLVGERRYIVLIGAGGQITKRDTPYTKLLEVKDEFYG
jgi:hypothetical protein